MKSLYAIDGIRKKKKKKHEEIFLIRCGSSSNFLEYFPSHEKQVWNLKYL